VQHVLNQPGRINEIRAIDCICLTAEQDALNVIRAELAQIVPEASVIQIRSLAEGRARQRQMMTRYARFLTPLVLGVCAVWVGTLAILNVRERRSEIGVLRALGRSSFWLATLFLGRAVWLGVGGGLLGYLVGSALAIEVGSELFPVTAKGIRAMPGLLVWALVVAPAFAALTCFVPAMMAVAQDPAVTLREE